jgi:hypothetical protein
METEILAQVEKLEFDADNAARTKCYGEIRQNIRNFVELAGISYTNCLNRVDNALFNEFTKIYVDLQVDESRYFGVGLMDAFKRENVFVTPDRIMENLDRKIVSFQEFPADLTANLNASLATFKQRLATALAAYSECMKSGLGLYAEGMTISDNSLSVSCGDANV